MGRSNIRYKLLNEDSSNSGTGTCLFIYNIFFTLAGVVVLAVGIWIRSEESVEHLTVILGASAVEYLYKASYILIGIGAFALMTGFLGCCGAQMDNNCLLSCLIFLLALVFHAAGAGVIMVALFRNKVIEQLVPNLKVTIAGYQPQLGNKAENAVALGWDYVQIKHECCGATNYTDYGGIFSHPNETYEHIYVPKSCCVLTNSDTSKLQPLNYDKCNEAASTPDNIDKNNEFLWTKNCTPSIKDTVGEKMNLLLYFGLGIAFLLFFWIALACCKCDGPGNKGFCVWRCRLNCK